MAIERQRQAAGSGRVQLGSEPQAHQQPTTIARADHAGPVSAVPPACSRAGPSSIARPPTPATGSDRRSGAAMRCGHTARRDVPTSAEQPTNKKCSESRAADRTRVWSARQKMPARRYRFRLLSEALRARNAINSVAKKVYFLDGHKPLDSVRRGSRAALPGNQVSLPKFGRPSARHRCGDIAGRQVATGWGGFEVKQAGSVPGNRRCGALPSLPLPDGGNRGSRRRWCGSERARAAPLP